MEYQPFADEPGYSGDWGALPGHLSSQAFSHRNLLSTLRFNLLLLFSLLQAKNKKKKKGNKNFRRMKFRTGNEIETTDTAAQQHERVCRRRAKRRSGKADEQAQGEHNFAKQTGETQTFTHKKKWSSVATMIFICSPAAGARCWLARSDNGMFCLIPEQPWLCLQLQPRPLNFPGYPEPLTVLLEGIWEGIALCPTGLAIGIIWSK